jgi:hypothetical protein
VVSDIVLGINMVKGIRFIIILYNFLIPCHLVAVSCRLGLSASHSIRVVDHPYTLYPSQVQWYEYGSAPRFPAEHRRWDTTLVSHSTHIPTTTQ